MSLPDICHPEQSFVQACVAKNLMLLYFLKQSYKFFAGNNRNVFPIVETGRDLS